MKLNLYEDKKNTDERVDIYYSNMRPVIKQLIDTVNSERPSLRGRPADEDEDDAAVDGEAAGSCVEDAA